MKIAIAAGGRFHAFHLAQQLEKRNSLEKLFTFYYVSNDKKDISQNLVCNSKINQLLDYLFSRLRLSKFIKRSDFFVLNDNLFDYWLSRKIKKIPQLDIFVGWAHYCLKSFENIRKTGAKIIIESGSCHILEQLKLLQEEYDKFGIKFHPVHKKNIEKMLFEYEQADYIMTISNFVYNSFLKQGVPAKKLLKVTCGIEVEYFLDQSNKLIKTDDKFRVICVGLLGLRKGIPYLLDAWEKLNLPVENTELLLVGNVQQDLNQVLKNLKIPKNVIFYGSTNKKTLAQLYKNSSLFVLPSIEDGFGMVIGEAMATGLPVICTTNTAGQDLIEDKKHGFIIPPQNSNILAEKILWCYKHKDESVQMGKVGQQHVKQFSWDNYGENVFQTYEALIGLKSGVSREISPKRIHPRGKTRRFSAKVDKKILEKS